MTIAVCLKVADGLVFGADSASTMGHGQTVSNVFTNAEKIFNLRKQLPVGAVSYGLGSLGGRSITSVAKDLRERFTDPSDDWCLDPDDYQMETVAERVEEFFIEDRWRRDFEQAREAWEEQQEENDEPDENDEEFEYQGLGFLIGGFSGDAVKPEVWKVEVGPQGTCDDPTLVYDKDEVGVSWRGVDAPLWRLLHGHAPEVRGRLDSLGVEDDVAEALVTSRAPLVNAAMPIQDAIDLVEYLANVTIGYVRFAPG